MTDIQKSLHDKKADPQPSIVYMQPAPDYDDDEINLLDYWRVLVAKKWLIIGSAFLSTCIAVAAALLMTEIYRAEVLLAPADQDKAGGLAGLAGQFGGLASLAGIDIGGGGGKTEETLAVLQSRSFINAFIIDNELMPILFEDSWDPVTKKWKVDDPEKLPTMWDAYKMFSQNVLSVSTDKTNGLITLAIEWKDPELAAEWANTLVDRVNAHQKRLANEEAKKSIAYLENQLRETSVVEMRQSIFNLIEAQTKNIMLANVRDEFAVKTIDPAVPPEERIKPKRKLMVILGFMVGLMLGVFLAFFISFIQNQKTESTAAATN
jgi:uncharacterized protein involved in exopolysaccharide biosynthesis